MKVLIVGCGYVGLPLGSELVREGHEVFGLRRSAGATAELEAAGIRPLIADITRPADLDVIPAALDWVVHCVSSSGGTVEDYRRVYLEGTRHVLERLQSRRLQKFAYTSSTSVYGQTDGGFVEETSPAEPDSETGRVLVATENLLLDAAKRSGFPALILRLSGIYGPNRGYLKGKARMDGSGERFLNLIHRDDAVGCIIAALKQGKPGEIYNATDDEPARQRSVFEWLAGRLGRPLPAVSPEAAARRRPATNKRVSNQKLKAELGYQFKYPDFRAGYAAEIKRLDGISTR